MPAVPNNWVIALTNWFALNQRTMPWRSQPEPYRVWISEIMLQQTQVDTVIPYFERFLARFPTVFDLANANLQEVLKLWEGLGYYSRARNLHKAAKLVANDFNGTLQSGYDDLQNIPGIGPYVAAAITSIAFGNPVPVVDGNVLRVFTRFWGISDDIRQPKVRSDLFERLTPYVQMADPSDFNQAIMELGALVCSPKSPKCHECPISSDCVAFATGRTSELPVKSKKPPTPHYTIAVGVIWKDGKILIGRRKETQMLGGLWEFPGGKCRDDEPLEHAVVREIKEETGLDVTVSGSYCTVKHAYTHFKITLTAYLCDYASGTACPKSADELRWISLDQIDAYPFPTANKKVIVAIREMTASARPFSPQST